MPDGSAFEFTDINRTQSLRVRNVTNGDNTEGEGKRIGSASDNSVSPDDDSVKFMAEKSGGEVPGHDDTYSRSDLLDALKSNLLSRRQISF